MSLRVADGHRRLVGQRRQQVGVVAEVRISRALGAEAEQADHLLFLDQRDDDLGPQAAELRPELPAVERRRSVRYLVAEDRFARTFNLGDERRRQIEMVRELAICPGYGQVETFLMVSEQ